MKKILAFICFLFIRQMVSAQGVDTTQTPSFFRGQITATNNGISLIPNFSLNKPAVLFDLSAGKGRLSFDPMFRFGMNGKPWTFIFWFRYKLVNRKKFSLSLGAHPSTLFRTETVMVGGVSKELMVTQRYLAWELAPLYYLNKKVGVGLYYLGSHGLTSDLVQITNFVAARAIVSNVRVGRHLSFSAVPQIYYLQQDTHSGTYLNATLGLSHRQCPVSVSATVNKALKTDIAGKGFLWSVGLVYNINNRYLRW